MPRIGFGRGLPRARAGLAAAFLAVAGVVGAGGWAPGARGQTGPPMLAPCASSHWVAAWTASPSGALGGGSTDQTLRIILTPHVGSPELRVHISNRFGAGPLSFARAAVGLRQAGAAVVVGSSRGLTFAGQAGVVLPPGGEVVSDPARLSFGPFQDLAVSLYVAGSTGPGTGHYIGRQRSYATAPSSGDHTGDEGGGAFVGATTAVAYVDAVDAMVPAGVGAAVLFGDSITDGYESVGPAGGEEQGGIDANQRFPDYLARRLLAEPGGPRLSVLNAGISGNRLLADGQGGLAGASGLSRLEADVLGTAGVTDAIVLEGINDIALAATADQVTGGLAQAVARLHGRGLHVLLGTIIPAGTGLLNLGGLLPPIYIDSPANATRVAVNAWIRSGASGADGVVDFDAALKGTVIPDELDPRFDSGDHLHPNPAGYRQMAAAVDLASLRGAVCTAVRLASTLHVRARAAGAGRLRVAGRLVVAGTTDCTGAAVTVKALHAGRTVLKRRVRVTAGCQFGATKPLAARGRIEVRVSFAGTAILGPTHARSVFVRAG